MGHGLECCSAGQICHLESCLLSCGNVSGADFARASELHAVLNECAGFIIASVYLEEPGLSPMQSWSYALQGKSCQACIVEEMEN